MILWRVRIAQMDSGDVQHIVEPDGSLMLPVAGWESPGLPGRPTRNDVGSPVAAGDGDGRRARPAIRELAVPRTS